MGDSPMKLTSNFFSSLPYLLVARHVKFRSSVTWKLAVLEVVFTRVVEFLITAMCMGRDPEAEHSSVRPGTARITVAGNNTFGETKKQKTKKKNTGIS